MKKNLPVTNSEYALGDDTMIVSKTDLKGKLTYFNDQFVTVSGFTEQELLGQPHNIVRHPDMPPEAFEDLWATLKAGKPWTGAVKNRRKDGGFYWVLATASPIWESGKMAGYMSIRTKLPADQRAEAERVYALIRNKERHPFTVTAGVIRRRSFADHLAFLNGSVKARLTSMAAGLTLQALMTAWAGTSGNPAVIAVAVIAALVVGGLLAATTIRAVIRPLDHLNAIMVHVAKGDFTRRVFVERDDEVGVALRNLQAMQAKLGYDRVEQADLERRTEMEKKAALLALADEFQAAVGGIVDTVSSTSTELERAASTLTEGADSARRLSSAVATASEQASSNVQSVASATAEMTASVNEIGRQVQESSRIAGEAVAQAEATNARITELSAAAEKIGDVVKLITGVAEQTNLLALNATIEAARAGDAGRGFAVVAQEVKALAAQTAKATEEIGAQIGSMQDATAHSVAAIREIGTTIARISEIGSTIASAAVEQGATTEEIARNIHEAARGTTEVAGKVSEVSRSAGQTGEGASQVFASARSLSSESGRLKREVERFLKSVRAG